MKNEPILKVLLVDDHEIYLDGLVRMIPALGDQPCETGRRAPAIVGNVILYGLDRLEDL